MTLEKLKITYEKVEDDAGRGRIEALFNPTQLVFDNKVSWRLDQSALDAKVVQHRMLNVQVVEPRTLSVELFFDTYEGDPRLASGFGRPPRLNPSPFAIDLGQRPSATSVRPYTDAMERLTRFDRELHRPPICRLHWGRWCLFEGVLSALTQEFSLFLEDGTPVRATLGCTFTEYLSAEPTPASELHSPDVAKTYTVRPGDTLVNVAAAFYSDASLWRVIAAANRIDDPRRLAPGRVLAIPPLPPGGGR